MAGSGRQDGLPGAGARKVIAKRALLAIAAILIGGCAYLSEKQGELIFRPSRDAWYGYDGNGHAFQDEWIPVGADGQKLHAWWLPGDKANAPALLYLHGARWNLTGSVSRIERWRSLGFAVLAVDYRGFGQSTDVAPTEEFAYQDAEAAWDLLGKLAPGKPRYIVGHSLGGAIAVDLASRHPEASGLVLEATFTSVQDMVAHSTWGFLPVSLILTQKFDALSKMGEVKVPVVIAHGTRDSIVPYEMGEQLFEAAHEPKRFISVEGAGHHNLGSVGAAQYRQVLSELFKLRPGS
ncbi:MAG TPA: alpha/beta fold hydrolase [Usitatibacter sp.]|nr:alpha/beta fold hydrolase [Usitatibacter sp.]